MNASDPIDSLTRLTHIQRAGLKRLQIESIRDLLYHFPVRYESAADIRTVSNAGGDEVATLYGKFSKLEMKRSWKTKVPMAEGTFNDGTGSMRIVWFHQPYLAKMIPVEQLVRIRGKVSEKDGKKSIINPVVEQASGVPFMKTGGEMFPVYPETAGITSLWIFHVIKKAIEKGALDTLEDPLPPKLLKTYHLPALKSALIWIHEPKREDDAEVARKRFAFEEVFLIQIARALEREKNKSERAYEIDADEAKVSAFVKTFPFDATAGQKKAIGAIIADFLEPYPMARLLEGDVGSGKTAIAAATAYAVATSRPKNAKGATQTFGNLQVAYMCPTEILAKQHFATFTAFFKKYPISIGLITSSGCFKFPSKVNPDKPTNISRAQLMKWVANGEIPILIGTHSLIQKTVGFKHLAYVIVDEQHRFGTLQRQAIMKKGGASPHLLSMTATPIPRTLALTLYGDLDLTVLDELPKGRKMITTEIVTAGARNKAYEKIRELLKEGRQAYVICPRIDEPDPSKALALQTRSVTAEAKRLGKEVFPEYTLEKLHSKMTPKEKEETMARFERGETNILVATSVVEVGVNVPNATVIMIEGADRFGLAQLHQLRGRVQRSAHRPYCFLMVEKSAGANNVRLKAIQSAKNGFELAEKDLTIRGAGELYGRRQWGISDIGMDALKNLKLVEAARKEAGIIVEKDSTLESNSLLRERALEKARELHFE
ncbi:MAG: ATP-dependent DNA helicase RecG [Parcubacteria group bacterium Greene0714_7]|nr:MAG: ATP-dependent DNA helicase RecG [Parcubacteria group bacterium Greene0714_7]